MSDVNVVVLTGGLTRDPELRDAGGTAVLAFGLGFSQIWRGPDGQACERSHYADVAVYGRRAEALAGILRKGMRVTVQGRLRFESWERDGERRSKLSVVAEEVSLPPRPRGAAQEDPQEAPEQRRAHGGREPQAELDLGDCGGYAGAYGQPADPRPPIPSPYGCY